MKYKKKATILFIFASLIPLFLMIIYFLGPYSTQQKEKISTLMKKNLYQEKYLLNNEIRNYQLSISTMMTNSLFTEPLNTIINKGKKESATEVNSLKNIFSEQTYLNNNIEGFFYLEDKSNTYFSYNKSNLTDEEIYQFIKTKAPNFKETIESANGSLTFIATQTIKTQSNENFPLLILGANFLDAQRTINRGYIFLLINEEKFSSFLNPIYDKQTIYTSNYLINSENNIISSLDKTLINKEYKLNQINNDNDYLDISIPLDKLNLNILSIYNEKDLYGKNIIFFIIPFFITLAALFFTLIIIKNYTNKVTQYVSDINESVTIKNDELNFKGSSNSDLVQINHEFDNLKTQLNQLLKEQTIKNNQLIEKEEEKRIAEIKALEAQVNPHFIYNTLNTLNWIAIEENNLTISNAISDLGDILRYSISHIHIKASLNEEITWLKKYLNLQILRYNNLFNYKITYQDNILDSQIYKLLFQPFVENSIVHGFKDIDYIGNININIFSETKETITIEIEDNGRGFKKKLINKSTGIDSSVNRLNLYYKAKSNIEITSIINKGTKVKITIPRIES